MGMPHRVHRWRVFCILELVGMMMLRRTLSSRGHSLPSLLYANRIHNADLQQIKVLVRLDSLSNQIGQYVDTVNAYNVHMDQWTSLRRYKEQQEHQRRLQEAQNKQQQQKEQHTLRQDRHNAGNVITKMLSWDRIAYATRKIPTRNNHNEEPEQYILKPEELPNSYYGIPEPPTYPDPPRGLYLYGQVGKHLLQGFVLHFGSGVGKSMLMDLFFEAVQINQGDRVTVKRIHFHSFMLFIHHKLHQYKLQGIDNNNESSIQWVSKWINGNYGSEDPKSVSVLCFDEFQINDIVDAVLLKGVFEELMKYRTVIVLTGNRPPDQINRSHLRKEDFQEFLAHLSQHCEFLELDSTTDYRTTLEIAPSKYYCHPISEETRTYFENMKGYLAKKESPADPTPKQAELELLMGRKIKVDNAVGKIAWFSFEELCTRPFGASDYMEIARQFHTVFLSDVPQMSIRTRDSARRFITLIDELYNHQTRLICLAEVPIDELFEGKEEDDDLVREILYLERQKKAESVQFEGEAAKKHLQHHAKRMLESTLYTGEDEAFAFKRAVSRLKEMQSLKYVRARNR
jgi:predicted ATPase